jgi:hypothetical protein
MNYICENCGAFIFRERPLVCEACDGNMCDFCDRDLCENCIEDEIEVEIEEKGNADIAGE